MDSNRKAIIMQIEENDRTQNHQVYYRFSENQLELFLLLHQWRVSLYMTGL